MDSRQKMAWTGTALIAAGVGMGVVGAALIAPATVAWVARMVEKGGTRLRTEIEGASRTVGTVAGTLQRSLNEAAKAGAAEWRRGSLRAGG